MAITVSVAARSGALLLAEVVVPDDSVAALQHSIASQKRINPQRQRLTWKETVLDPSQSLSHYGITSGAVIVLKDLGPQVSWTAVFLTEYAGPILLHSLFYYGQAWLYPAAAASSAAPVHTELQTVVFAMNVAHYLKRELETLFVHRFSNATMPLRNLPKNCFHYWVLGGLMLAYPMYVPPAHRAAALTPMTTAQWACVGIWLWAELSNLLTHLTLRRLRPPGSKERRVPYGYGFNRVACPNYTFEIIGWVTMAAMTGSAVVALFAAVGAIQMYFWACKKDARYRKDFGKTYPAHRKILIPYLL